MRQQERRRGTCRRSVKRAGIDRRAIPTLPMESEEVLSGAVDVLFCGFDAFAEYREERLALAQRTEEHNIKG